MKAFLLAAILSIFVACRALPAFAQSNTVSLGQIGDTNAIRIDQTGADNRVGATPQKHWLNQFGNSNEIQIDQFGNSNIVGALDIETFGAVQGLNQIGDRNLLDIDQTTGRIGGANMIGAIRQEAGPSPLGGGAVANRLVMRQTGTGSDDAGDHFVGTVYQMNLAPGPENAVSLAQTGGGLGAGHRIESIVQGGAGNGLTAIQGDRDNRIGRIEQRGTDNAATLQQDRGEENRVESLLQDGGLNRAEITQSGTGNVAADIRQINAGRAVSGNRLALSFSGNDNGGDGALGAFGLNPGRSGAFDAGVAQIGDGNDLSYTVGASGALGSDRNRFSFWQEGDGNGLFGTVSGDENEAAARQTGDGNTFDFRQTAAKGGGGNLIAARQDGDGNQLFIEQEGSGNTARVSIVGDRNIAAPMPRDVTPVAGSLMAGLDLPSGGLVQLGQDNDAVLDVIGDFNAFAVLQAGAGNRVTGLVSGAFNQAFVMQTSDNNIARLSQSGERNVTFISQ